MDLFEDAFFIAHGDGSLADCCVAAEDKFDCLLAGIGFLQNLVFDGLSACLLFFSAVAHYTINSKHCDPISA